MEQIRVTEQASAYDDLQRMSVHDLLTGINREDRRVADAVAATIPTMERLVERIVERMQRGGRMFYIGAGTSGRLAVTDASELPPTYGVPFDTVIGLIAGGDGALRIDATVENGSDRDLTLEIVLAEINGLSVLGYGVYNVYAGESVVDYIVFDAEGDAEVAAALAAPQSLRFTIWAYDTDTGETFFTTDVTL